MSGAGVAYWTAAQSLRARILRGEWSAGAQLPAERALCAALGISRITLRHALSILEEEGLLLRQQGRGTFVNARPQRRIPIVNGDFSSSISRHAPELRRTVLDFQEQPAEKAQAMWLGLLPGDMVLMARRLDWLGKNPTAFDEVAMPRRLAAGLACADFMRIDFLEYLCFVRHWPLEYETQTVEAVPAPVDVAARLRVSVGAPLLQETNVAYFAGGQPAILFTSYYRHEYYQFRSTSRIADRKFAQLRTAGSPKTGGGVAKQKGGSKTK